MFAHFFGHLPSLTDADLQTRITSHLETRGYPAFRDLTVAARKGVVTLDGWLPSYFVKQVAIETCRHIAGVMQVIDAIQVGPSCFNAARLLTPANELPAHRTLNRLSRRKSRTKSRSLFPWPRMSRSANGLTTERTRPPQDERIINGISSVDTANRGGVCGGLIQ
jgi:BON domain-containing protein